MDSIASSAPLDTLCPHCLRPKATDALWGHESGCVCVECVAHCWREADGHCNGHELTPMDALRRVREAREDEASRRIGP